MDFVEFQDFGWNAVTISFIGTMFFLLLQSWGSISQAKTIWQKKSGLSVSVPLFFYSSGCFFVGFLYGLSINSLVLIIVNAVLFLIHVFIILGLIKFKEFKIWEKFFAIIVFIVLLVSIFLPFKDFLFLIFNIGTIVMLFFQPWEIWKNKDAGAVEPRLNISFFLSSIFWLIYGIAIDDWVLQIVIPFYLILHVSILIMWYVYKKPSRND